MRQRLGKSIARAKFINTALLGRKRPVMEKVIDIIDCDLGEDIQPLMKELETILRQHAMKLYKAYQTYTMLVRMMRNPLLQKVFTRCI